MRRIESFEEFAQQCEFFVDTASDYQTDFVVFPELITNQLLSPGRARAAGPGGAEARRVHPPLPRALHRPRDQVQRQHRRRLALHGRGGPALQHRVPVPPRRHPREAVQAPHHAQRATLVGGERRGSELDVFETDRGRIAILTLLRRRVPRARADRRRQGGAACSSCRSTPTSATGYLRVRYCAQARCIENHIYVAIAGCVGNLPFVENADIHYAQSGIFTPADIPFAARRASPRSARPTSRPSSSTTWTSSSSSGSGRAGPSRTGSTAGRTSTRSATARARRRWSSISPSVLERFLTQP